MRQFLFVLALLLLLSLASAQTKTSLNLYLSLPGQGLTKYAYTEGEEDQAWKKLEEVLAHQTPRSIAVLRIRFIKERVQQDVERIASLSKNMVAI